MKRQENKSNEENFALQRVSSDLESDSRTPSPPDLQQLESYFQSQEHRNQTELSASDSHLHAEEPDHQQPEPLPQQPETQVQLQEMHRQMQQSEQKDLQQDPRHQAGQSASPLEIKKHDQTEQSVFPVQSQESRHHTEKSMSPVQTQEQHSQIEQPSEPKSQWQDQEQWLQTEITKSQLELQEQHHEMEQEPEQDITGNISISPDLPPRSVRNRPSLYNFKGFMLFCFGVPGISPNWCSKYYAWNITIPSGITA